MTRWETIAGTSHVVEHTQADRDEYPWSRPGDRVVRLEADAQGKRVAARFVVPGSIPDYAKGHIFARGMTKAVHQLETLWAT